MNRIPSRRMRRRLRRLARRWKTAQPPPEPVRLYTCPRCHEKAAALPLWSLGDDVRMRCRACGYECSAYEAPLEEWPTLTFGTKREETFHG